MSRTTAVPRYRWLSVVAVAGALALLAACSSSSGSGAAGSATPAASGPTGSTVLIGDITSEGTPVENQPNAVAGVKAAIRAVNAAGGIGGHKVALDYCNPSSNANQAAACARKMVSDHVIAVTGDEILTADIDPILLTAKIPQVGFLPVSSGDFTDSNSFLFDAGPVAGSAAAIQYYAQHGGKGLFLAYTDVPTLATAGAIAKATAAATHLAYQGAVPIPATATDLTPDVVKIKDSSAAGVQLLLGTDELDLLIRSAGQTGVTGKTYLTTGSDIAQSDINGWGQAGGNVVYGQPMPPLSAAGQISGIKQFLADMTAEANSGDASAARDSIDQGTMEGWLAVRTIAKIIPTHTTNVTASTVMAALESAKDINMGGLIPPWTPMHPGPTGTPRVSNTFMWVVKVDGTTPVLAQPTAIDTASLP
jgi:ABC-type branched-subunit amino acid transport system substrate-binding protein